MEIDTNDDGQKLMYGGAFWKNDKRDHIAQYILGAIASNAPIKKSVKMYTIPHNQGGTVRCTAYTSTHVAQIQNEVEHQKKINGDPDGMWEEQKKFGTYSSNGDFIDTALKNLEENGLLTTGTDVYPNGGYAKITKTWKEAVYWLSNLHPLAVISAVTKTNFNKARMTGVWPGVDGPESGGHAWTILGHEIIFKANFNKPLIYSNLEEAVDVAKSYFWGLQSYGPKHGFFGDGTFRVPFNQFNDIWSAYLTYDITDKKMIFKDVADDAPLAASIKEAKELGLMNGYEDGRFGPENLLTRAEAAALAVNIYKKLAQ